MTLTTFANVPPYDCSLVTDYTYTWGKIVGWGSSRHVLSQDAYGVTFAKGFTTIYPFENLATAFHNLASYCADLSVLPVALSETFRSNTYPESVYLFDHIVDVGMRYLDGDQQSQHEGAIVDENFSTERRDKIRELTENPDGQNPLVIQETYRDIFGPEDPLTVKFGKSCSTVDEIIDNRDDMKHQDKYYSLCPVALCLSTTIFGSDVTQRQWAEKGVDEVMNRCYAQVRQRIVAEQNYVTIQSTKKAGEQLNVANFAYISYLQKRGINLGDSMTNRQSSLAQVAKQSAPTRICK